jgi:hypothetical protein
MTISQYVKVKMQSYGIEGQMWEHRQTGMSHQRETENKLQYESLCVEMNVECEIYH